MIGRVLQKRRLITQSGRLEIRKYDCTNVKQSINLIFYTSTKHVEHLKDLNIPSMSTSAAPASKLSSLIKSKAPKQSVNRLSTYSTLK